MTQADSNGGPKRTGSNRIPEDQERSAATRFVLELDLDHLTQDDLDYLHKLRNMAQRRIAEDYLRKRYLQSGF